MSSPSFLSISPRAFRSVLPAFLIVALAGRSLSSPSYGFADGFDAARSLSEAGSLAASTSPSWWVSSGGYLKDERGFGMTVQGALPSDDPWRRAYAASNPTDTDDGYHPQNIFRLVARGVWKNFTQQAWFRIERTHASASPNRNASNGLFFFNRYVDANNVYYTGIRVDGAAVIKKKVGGRYVTLAYRKIFAGSYDRERSANLLPTGSWIGLRTVTADDGSGGVMIRIEIDHPSLGAGWVPVVSATDRGTGGSVIDAAGHAGLRTDFMDVQFENYSAVETDAPLDGAVETAAAARALDGGGSLEIATRAAEMPRADRAGAAR